MNEGELPAATSWLMIAEAAAGNRSQQRRFAHRYHAVVERCLASRWQQPPHAQHVDDAIQEVFVECFREGGVLQSTQASRPRSFRAFLVGAVRNVARRFEAGGRVAERDSEVTEPAKLDRVAATDHDLLQVFEREWARAMVAEAMHSFASEARASGDAAANRVELLRLRFQEGLPIRTIAARWEVATDRVHREYALARKEFRACLMRTVAEHDGLSRFELEAECERLTHLLS